MIERLEHFSTQIYKEHQTAVSLTKHLGLTLVLSGLAYLTFVPPSYSAAYPLATRIAKGVSVCGVCFTLTGIVIRRYEENTPSKEAGTASSSQVAETSLSLTPSAEIFKGKVSLALTTSGYLGTNRRFAYHEHIRVNNQPLHVQEKDHYYYVQISPYLTNASMNGKKTLERFREGADLCLPSSLFEQSKQDSTFCFEVDNISFVLFPDQAFENQCKIVKPYLQKRGIFYNFEVDIPATYRKWCHPGNHFYLSPEAKRIDLLSGKVSLLSETPLPTIPEETPPLGIGVYQNYTDRIIALTIEVIFFDLIEILAILDNHQIYLYAKKQVSSHQSRERVLFSSITRRKFSHFNLNPCMQQGEQINLELTPPPLIKDGILTLKLVYQN